MNKKKKIMNEKELKKELNEHKKHMALMIDSLKKKDGAKGVAKELLHLPNKYIIRNYEMGVLPADVFWNWYGMKVDKVGFEILKKKGLK